MSVAKTVRTKLDPVEEPVRLHAVQTGGAVGLIAAFIVLLQEFGVDITDGQQLAIVAFVGVAVPILQGFFRTRKKTTPAFYIEADAADHEDLQPSKLEQETVWPDGDFPEVDLASVDVNAAD